MFGSLRKVSKVRLTSVSGDSASGKMSSTLFCGEASWRIDDEKWLTVSALQLESSSNTLLIELASLAKLGNIGEDPGSTSVSTSETGESFKNKMREKKERDV